MGSAALPLLNSRRAPVALYSLALLAYTVRSAAKGHAPHSVAEALTEWILAPQLMAYALLGVTAAIALSDLFPSIPVRTWRLSTGAASIAGALLSCLPHRTLDRWPTEFPAFLLGFGIAALAFSRVDPELGGPPPAQPWRAALGVVAFVTFVCSVDATLQDGLRHAIQDIDDRWRYSLIHFEFYFAQAYLALGLLRRARLRIAAIGLVLILTQLAGRRLAPDSWHLWRWMPTFAALLLAFGGTSTRRSSTA